MEGIAENHSNFIGDRIPASKWYFRVPSVRGMEHQILNHAGNVWVNMACDVFVPRITCPTLFEFLALRYDATGISHRT